MKDEGFKEKELAFWRNLAHLIYYPVLTTPPSNSLTSLIIINKIESFTNAAQNLINEIQSFVKLRSYISRNNSPVVLTTV